MTSTPALEAQISLSYLASGTGAVARPVEDKLDSLGPSPADYSNLFTGAAAKAIATAELNGGAAYAWAGYNQSAIIIDAGIYDDVASINATTMPIINIQARTPGTVTLDRTAETDYLFTKTNALSGSYFKGFNLWGGKGLLRHSHSGNNVQGFQIFEDLVLIDFEECAVSTDSDDMPYFKLLRDVFRGADGSISFATSGFYDASSIIECEFHNGRYGIKSIGERSSTLSIERCSFLTIRPEEDFTVNELKEADIWLGPSGAFVTAGSATIIRQNKFGPENMPLDKPRLIFADEDDGSGASGADRGHSSDASTGFVDGICITENAIFGRAGEDDKEGEEEGDPITAPFIRTYTPKVSRLHFDRNWTGAPHTLALEYAVEEAAEDTYDRATNYLRVFPGAPGERAFRNGISNRCRGIYESPFGDMQWDPNVQFGGVNDECSYTLLKAGQGIDGTLYHATGAPPASPFKGCPNALEVTFTAADGLWRRFLDPVTPGVPSRCDVWIKQGESLPISSFTLWLFNLTTNKSAILNGCRPSAEGAGQSIFFVAGIDEENGWELRVRPDDWAAGVATKIQIGHHHIYHGRSPMNRGHLYTAGSGAHDDSHIVLGAYHLWVDSTGKLRINDTAPTSDVDGTVVGSQS